MIRTVRLIIVIAAVSLLVASMIHLEVLTTGHRHQQAGTAEAVIGAVMLVGLGLTWLPGRRPLSIGLLTLWFGLLGTLVGVFTIIIGVGPQTTADIVYHLLLIALLATGVAVARKGRRETTTTS
ncbi:MAG: hypothetical protein WAL25_08440 [Acidimicrobiia bacterium]